MLSGTSVGSQGQKDPAPDLTSRSSASTTETSRSAGSPDLGDDASQGRETSVVVKSGVTLPGCTGDAGRRPEGQPQRHRVSAAQRSAASVHSSPGRDEAGTRCSSGRIPGGSFGD